MMDQVTKRDPFLDPLRSDLERMDLDFLSRMPVSSLSYLVRGHLYSPLDPALLLKLSKAYSQKVLIATRSVDPFSREELVQSFQHLLTLGDPRLSNPLPESFLNVIRTFVSVLSKG